MKIPAKRQSDGAGERAIILRPSLIEKKRRTDPFTLQMTGRSPGFLARVYRLYFSFLLAVVFLPTDFIIYLPLVFWRSLSWDYWATNRMVLSV